MIRLFFITGIALLATTLGFISSSSAVNYSEGSYGSCQYESCSLSLASTPTVAVNVTPSGATTCSVQSGTVTATTDASTGYTISLNNADTSSSLDGQSGNSIASTNGTSTTPLLLTANSWGYRVDTIESFGTGPTTSVTNGGIPTQTFAATPASNAAGALIKTTATADGSGVAESVWYGVCVDTNKPSGVYSDAVVYTAVIN